MNIFVLVVQTKSNNTKTNVSNAIKQQLSKKTTNGFVDIVMQSDEKKKLCCIVNPFPKEH